jgi:CRISPR-associated endoribonuclease Cas6
MKLKINISPKTGELLLPKHYMRALSAAAWRGLSLEEKKSSGRPKLICFSPLLFKERKVEGDKIRLKGKWGSFLVSSPINEIIKGFENFPKEIEIAGNSCNIQSFEIKDDVNFENRMVWKTLPGAGICTKKPSLEKTETFVTPKIDGEAICEQSLLNSLNTKWAELCKVEADKAIRWCDDNSPSTWAMSNQPKIKILKFDYPKLNNIKKNSKSFSWSGIIEVTGHEAWQRLIWDTGLGSKTGVGHGSVEPKTEKRGDNDN